MRMSSDAGVRRRLRQRRYSESPQPWPRQQRWHFLPAVHNSTNPPCAQVPTRARSERLRRRCNKRSNRPTRLPGCITTRKTQSSSLRPRLRFKVEQRCSTCREPCSASHPSLSRRSGPRPRAASHQSMHARLGSTARTPVGLQRRASEPSSCGARNPTAAGASLKSCFTLSRSPSRNGAVTPDPSIERTSERPLRALCAQAHVGR
jgi:hypothetical protein